MAKRSLEIKYFAERPFLYDWEEYVKWRAGDKGLIDYLLDICGPMGQDRDVLSGPQTKKGRHYPEVKYAAHCVQNKYFQPKFIYYEKYRLSQQFIMSLSAKSNNDAILFRNAHNQLSKIFSKNFFVEFDKLISLNKEKYQRKDDIFKISVDLCAIVNKKRQVHFIESITTA